MHAWRRLHAPLINAVVNTRRPSLKGTARTGVPEISRNPLRVRMRNNNQILHSDQTILDETF